MNNFENKRVLITGATGLLGYNLTNHLIKSKNVHVTAISRSLKKLRKCFSIHKDNTRFSYIEHDVSSPLYLFDYPVDYIFHAASPQENKIISESPVDVINANILGTMNCIDFLINQEIEHNVKGRLVLFSSVTIYGNNTTTNLVVKETDTSLTEKIESIGASYSQSKRMSEVIARAYSKQFNLDVVTSRLSTVYGDTLIKTDTAFFEFINNAILGQDIHINKSANPRRDNIYLDDAISGLLLIALKGKTNEVYNVSSNGELENFQAVDEIASIIAEETNKIFGTTRSRVKVINNDFNKVKRQPGIILDNTKLKKLGWTLKTSFKDGIAKTLQLNIPKTVKKPF
ncbi:MAG: NAD(P)-dependent oxidoreductase [Candidatus Marinimicrobia bacterium]|nr:NAD(P)-dependent oxidoreductase [Candidatus Neomarinimicrobiota bacterium]